MIAPALYQRTSGVEVLRRRFGGTIIESASAVEFLRHMSVVKLVRSSPLKKQHYSRPFIFPSCSNKLDYN